MILDPKLIIAFKQYLKLERNLSPNTVESYSNDLALLNKFLESRIEITHLNEIKRELITIFISTLSKKSDDLNFHNPTSQARIISGLKSFFKFLQYDEILKKNPLETISQPKLEKKLPKYLEVHEIDLILNSIDLSLPEGVRNRAIYEILFSTGIRISELVEMKMTNLFLEVGFVKVIGKGNKERLVTIGDDANKYISQYIDQVRVHQKIDPKFENYIFLNSNRGQKISRQYIFLDLKKIAKNVGLNPEKISPHIFRHSFATHMIGGGADLRVVQELLGHTSITNTEIYTHIDKEFLIENINSFHPRSKLQK